MSPATRSPCSKYASLSARFEAAHTTRLRTPIPSMRESPPNGGMSTSGNSRSISQNDTSPRPPGRSRCSSQSWSDGRRTTRYRCRRSAPRTRSPAHRAAGARQDSRQRLHPLPPSRPPVPLAAPKSPAVQRQLPHDAGKGQSGPSSRRRAARRRISCPRPARPAKPVKPDCAPLRDGWVVNSGAHPKPCGCKSVSISKAGPAGCAVATASKRRVVARQVSGT